MKFESYFYYSKNDSKKEAIDKVGATCEEHAATYFAECKKINEETFKQLYNIEIYVENKFR